MKFHGIYNTHMLILVKIGVLLGVSDQPPSLHGIGSTPGYFKNNFRPTTSNRPSPPPIEKL